MHTTCSVVKHEFQFGSHSLCRSLSMGSNTCSEWSRYDYTHQTYHTSDVPCHYIRECPLTSPCRYSSSQYTHSIGHMPQYTHYATVYTLRHSIHATPQYTRYATVYTLRHSIHTMPQYTQYVHHSIYSMYTTVCSVMPQYTHYIACST